MTGQDIKGPEYSFVYANERESKKECIYLANLINYANKINNYNLC